MVEMLHCRCACSRREICADDARESIIAVAQLFVYFHTTTVYYFYDFPKNNIYGIAYST